MQHPTERFTPTVQDYVKYRPSYPRQIIDVLINECDLTPNKIIADVGSGTGLLTQLFLDYGNTVYGVEPNQAMRDAAEIILKDYAHFNSVDGTAETTTLSSHSIDLVTVGTAFHWFKEKETKLEFRRILKKPGWVLLVWNVKNTAQSAMMQEYEQLLLKYGTDFQLSNASKFERSVDTDFFHPNEMKIHSFSHSQFFDWNGLQGRLLSTSYVLRPDNEKYAEMITTLKSIFDKYQQNGMVEFSYMTKLYYGCIHDTVK